MELFTLLFLVSFRCACATNINSLISTDTLFTALNSPYFVIGDTLILEDVTLTIENGVEIIFADYYEITVSGILNVGCYDYDTLSITDNHRGLDNSSFFVYIHSELYDRNGMFVFDRATNYSATFCNTKFDGLSQIFEFKNNNYDQSKSRIILDNCEMTNLNYVGYIRSPSGGLKHLITDSYIHDCYSGIEGDGVEVNNCLFENLESIIFNSDGGNFYNNTIIGNNSTQCILTEGTNYIENNTITNCDIALNIYSSTTTIELNDLSNNNIAIQINEGSGNKYIIYNVLSNNNIAVSINSAYYSGANSIYYNNFIDNALNLQLSGDIWQPSGGYNYWGINTSNQSIIADTILDMCDSYSIALFTFWPWFKEPINYGSDNVPTLFSFDWVDCSSINDVISYIVTSATTAVPITHVPVTTSLTTLDLSSTDTYVTSSATNLDSETSSTYITSSTDLSATKLDSETSSTDSYATNPDSETTTGSYASTDSETTAYIVSSVFETNSTAIDFETCIEEYSLFQSDGIQLGIKYNNVYNKMKITLRGPTTKWFGIGFGSDEMINTYSVIVSGSLFDVKERILDDHDEGIIISNSTFDEKNSSILSGYRYVEVTRNFNAHESYDFTDYFECNILNLEIIWATGATLNYGYHKEKGSVRINNCVCTETPTFSSITPSPIEDIFDMAVMVNCSVLWITLMTCLVMNM